MTPNPAHIDQIRFMDARRQDGSHYQLARVWIAGLPLQIDLNPHVERIMQRIATQAGLTVIDCRAPAHPSTS